MKGLFYDNFRGTFEQFTARCVVAGTRRVSIFLPSHGKLHLSRYRPDTLARMTKELADRSIAVWWCIWLYSDADKLDAQAKEVEAALEACQRLGVCPAGLDLDAEGHWGKSGVGLASRVGELYYGLDLAVTSIPWVKGPRPQDLALLHLPAVRTAIPQAYSQYQGKDHWSARELFRPGVIQRHTAETWLHFRDAGVVDTVLCGQAFYAQNHPAPWPRGIEALQVAYDTAAALGFDGQIGWSSKHVDKAEWDWYGAVTAGGNVYAPAKVGASREVERLQAALLALGYQPGPVDGVMGPRTRSALQAYRHDETHRVDVRETTGALSL